MVKRWPLRSMNASYMCQSQTRAGTSTIGIGPVPRVSTWAMGVVFGTGFSGTGAASGLVSGLTAGSAGFAGVWSWATEALAAHKVHSRAARRRETVILLSLDGRRD